MCLLLGTLVFGLYTSNAEQQFVWLDSIVVVRSEFNYLVWTGMRGFKIKLVL